MTSNEKGLKDRYGNNTNFPDNVVSDMTIKGLLGKWTDLIASDVHGCLRKYYMRTRNIDAGVISIPRMFFEETNTKIETLTPILEDLVAREIYGIEDIFIAVFGIKSDQVYVIRRFKELYEKMPEWDEDYMWNDCQDDIRMLEIMYHGFNNDKTIYGNHEE